MRRIKYSSIIAVVLAITIFSSSCSKADIPLNQLNQNTSAIVGWISPDRARQLTIDQIPADSAQGFFTAVDQFADIQFGGTAKRIQVRFSIGDMSRLPVEGNLGILVGSQEEGNLRLVHMSDSTYWSEWGSLASAMLDSHIVLEEGIVNSFMDEWQNWIESNIGNDAMITDVQIEIVQESKQFVILGYWMWNEQTNMHAHPIVLFCTSQC